jgi:hypothetical protein
MSENFQAAEFRVNVAMDGTDGLTGLLTSLKSLQESVERLASSTEASYARMGRAAQDLESKRAGEALKTEGVRQREATKTAELAQRLADTTASYEQRKAAETAANLETINARSEADAERHARRQVEIASEAETEKESLARRAAFAQEQADARAEAQAVEHAARMAELKARSDLASAASRDRVAFLQERVQASQLVSGQKHRQDLEKLSASTEQTQALAVTRASAAVATVEGQQYARRLTLAQQHEQTMALNAQRGAANVTAIATKAAENRAAIELRADRAMELEAERSANRLAAIRSQNLGRLGGGGGSGMGIGSLLGIVGAQVGAQSFISDSIKDAGIYYSLLAANNNDESAARVQQQQMYSIANRRGADYLKTADQFTGVYAAGRAQGMSNDDLNKGMDGWLSMFQARHIDDSSQKRALYAVSEMLSGSRLQTKEAYRQLGSNDIKGLFPEISQFLIANSDGRLKNEADVKASLAGKAGSDGKVYQIDPKAFFEQFSQYLGTKYGAASDEASEKSPQTAINRFKNSIHDLNLELGKSGVIDVFVNMLRGLTNVLKDPGVVAAVHSLGENVQKWAEAMKPMITSLANFIAQHEDGVKTFGEIVAGTMAINAAFKLLISPFLSIASSAMSLFGTLGTLGEGFAGLSGVIGPLKTAFGGLVSLFGDGLIALLAGFDSRLPAAFGRIGTSIAAGTSNLLATATGAFGGFFSGLAARLSAMIGGLLGSLSIGGVAAAGLAISSVAGVGVMALDANKEMHKKQDALDIINSYDPKEVQSAKLTDLMDRKATLQKAENSWSTSGILGGHQRDSIKQMVDLLESEMKRRSDIGAAKHKSELDNENKRLQSRQTEADAKTAKAATPLISEAPGKAKKKKGDGGSPDLGADMQDAQADFSNAITHARDLYELEEDKQKQLLRDGKIGFEEYYTNRRTAVEKLYATEKKAAEDRQAADMTAEKEKEARAAKAGNARAVAAAQTREQTLATNADTELAKIDMERRKTLEQINEEHKKEATAYQKMVDAAEKRVEKAHGTLGVGADTSDITDKYDDQLKQVQEHKNPDGSIDQKAYDAIKENERLDLAHDAYGSKKDDIGVKNSGYDDQIQGIKDQVSQGDLSEGDAENQILAIKKQEAAADLQILENAKALNGPISDQLAINKQIREAKAQINAESKMEQEIEKDIANDLGQALDKVMTGKERPIQAGKQFLLTLSQQIEGKLSQSVADEIVTGLKNGFDQANGSSNLFTQLTTGLENALKQALNSVTSSSSSSSSGGIGSLFSNLFSGIGSLFGGGSSSTSTLFGPDSTGVGGTDWSSTVGGNGYGFTMPAAAGLQQVSGGNTFNMNVATQDLSSFNASQSQIMSGMSTRISMAGLRN